MIDNKIPLEQRIKEFNEFYVNYSSDDNYPLLSIRPDERVLVLISNPTRDYGFSEGQTLIVGSYDEKSDTELPLSASHVIKVIRDKMLLRDILQIIKDNEYSRILYDNRFDDEDKMKVQFFASILQGITLEIALDRWNSVKETVTQEELDTYNQSVLFGLKDVLSEYDV